MAHLYVLTGPLPSDPRYLEVTTDDDGLISELVPPNYRAANQTIKSLVASWHQYVEDTGSVPQTITQFREYILDTYGQMYIVRDVW